MAGGFFCSTFERMGHGRIGAEVRKWSRSLSRFWLLPAKSPEGESRTQPPTTASEMGRGQGACSVETPRVQAGIGRRGVKEEIGMKWAVGGKPERPKSFGKITGANHWTEADAVRGKLMESRG